MRRRPVIIGVGQTVYRGPPQVSETLSPVGLAAEATKIAIADTSASPELVQAIDAVAAIRLFGEYDERAKQPFGRANNFPRAIANRVGVSPRRAIYSTVGGQNPQRLVNELCGAIANGEHDVALIVGAEATGLLKSAQRASITLNWNEEVSGDLEDRGFGAALVNKAEARHGLYPPVNVYGLIEHALRARKGRSRGEHQAAMAELFAKFSEVAANNPYAQFPTARSAGFLSESSADNYFVSDPFTKWLVAQDAVNQGAAIILASEMKADELGVPLNRRIFLHGHADADDVAVSERPEIGKSRPLELAAQRALEAAKVDASGLPYVDLYSCFPCAVFTAREAFGFKVSGSPSLTLTGGLPFFGGAGNSYSLFAIAEVVQRLRQDREAFGLISANGGYLSKQSIGIYSARVPSTPWRDMNAKDLTEEIRAEAAEVCLSPEGTGVIETFTVPYNKGTPIGGAIIGRVHSTGQRFVAVAAPGDAKTLAGLIDGEPIGRTVSIKPCDKINHFAFVN